jgi:ABC-type bacteriocin/lantibiotic exporter with double-glycine peptidase domain
VSSDAWLYYKKRLLSLIFMLAGTLLCKMAATGLIVWYAGALEKGGSISIYNITILSARTSYEMLFGVLFLLSMLLVIAAILQFIADKNAFHIGVSYEKERNIRAMRALCKFSDSVESFVELKKFGKILSVDSKNSGVFLAMASKLPFVLMAIIILFLLLIYLDPVLISVVTMFFLLSLPWLYKVNIRGSLHSKLLEENSIAEREEKWNIVSALSRIKSSADEDILNKVEGKVLQDVRNSYFERLVTPAKSRLVMSIWGAICLFIVVLMKGVDIIEHGEGWHSLILFIFILRIFQSYCTQFVSILTSANRYYHYLDRYMRVTEFLNSEIDRPAVLTTNAGGFLIKTNELEESIDES